MLKVVCTRKRVRIYIPLHAYQYMCEYLHTVSTRVGPEFPDKRPVFYLRDQHRVSRSYICVSSTTHSPHHPCPFAGETRSILLVYIRTYARCTSSTEQPYFKQQVNRRTHSSCLRWISNFVCRTDVHNYPPTWGYYSYCCVPKCVLYVYRVPRSNSK